MASAHGYSWTRADGSTGKAYRAKWIGVDGRPRSKRGFDRKTDAYNHAVDREAESRHGVTLAGEPPSGKTTVEAWVKTWLESRRVRPGTLDAYRYALKRVTDSLGGRSLSSLRASELRAWRRGLDGRLAPSTATQTAAVFAMVLHDAVVDGLLVKSPMPAQSRADRIQRVVDPDELLTMEQVRAWDAALPEWAQGMAVVAATTGLRQGELLGLCVSEVDFLRKRVRVKQQLQRGQLTPPKTAAGSRTVPLPDLAVDALAAHIAAHPSPDGEPIFLSRYRKRWSRTGFNSIWTTARDRATWVDRSGKKPVERIGLPEWAHWHALRDVAASGLIRQGKDMKTVMAIMGHSSPDETYRTYARLWPDALDDATKALNDLWGSG